MGAQEKSPTATNSMQRVKVYQLNDDGKWDDKGTGHVSVDYLERSEELGLFVIDEEDNETLLLHRIRSDDIYQKQEDTIISWRDPEFSTELALSFQETTGCSYIWDHICSVQRNLHFNTVNCDSAMSSAPTNFSSSMPVIGVDFITNSTSKDGVPTLTSQSSDHGTYGLINDAELESLLSRLEKPIGLDLLDISTHQGAVSIQSGVILSLQSAPDIDSMIDIANGIFVVFKRMGLSFTPFFEKVRTFIKYSILLARLSNLPDQSSAIEDLEAQYQSRKLHLDKVTEQYEEVFSLVIKSGQHVTKLEESISRTKELLLKLGTQLSSSKTEHSSRTSRLTQIAMDVSKLKKDLQSTLDALAQCKEKSVSHTAVKQAFDRANAALSE